MSFENRLRLKYKPKGLTFEELLFLVKPRPHAFWSFHDSEVYGCGKWMRNYARFPQWLPMRFLYEHGPNQWDIPMPHIHSINSWRVGFYSKRLTDVWNKTHKNGIQILSPFVYYRRSQGIARENNAKGTLIFHAHSTEWTQYHHEISQFLDELKMELPESFYPLSVCLHYCDVRAEIIDEYHKFGIPCFTAGHWNNPFFIENFYEILKNFQYAASNAIGSQAFYATEMGIPFSIIGTQPIKIRSNDFNNQNIDVNDYHQIRYNYKIFSGIQKFVTPEQFRLTHFELGLDSGFSACKAQRVMWCCLFYSIFISGYINILNCIIQLKNICIKSIKFLLYIVYFNKRYKDKSIDKISFRNEFLNKFYNKND